MAKYKKKTTGLFGMGSERELHIDPMEVLKLVGWIIAMSFIYNAAKK